MLRPDLSSRVRAVLVALAAPLGAAAVLACDATEHALLDPDVTPQLDYASGGDPEPVLCNDPTPGERWTASITPAGGTFNMGPNTVIVPANAVSTSGLLYFRELSSSTLQVRITANVAINSSLEVIVSAENCEVDVAQTVWLYDEVGQDFEDLVDGDYDTGTTNMRFWTIQPGAYALAN